MEEIKVSISCIVYNQEYYIEQAIQGFLKQKTNFKFEVLIHDDASTDGTGEIIKKYEKMYPDIIKPLIQKENQYSKGVKVGLINNNRAKGKYIALCEGDDYWIDEDKLQKQYDYMENNPECSLVFSNSRVWDSKIGKYVKNKEIESRVYDIEEIVELGGGFVPTATIFYRKKHMNNPPMFYINGSVGDYPLQMHLATKGTVYCLEDITAVYRFRCVGSWTEKDDRIDVKVLNNKKIIRILKAFNTETKQKYKKAVLSKILQLEFENYIYENNVGIEEIKKTKFKDYFIRKFSEMSLKEKVIMYLQIRSTKNYSKLKEIRGKIKKCL